MHSRHVWHIFNTNFIVRSTLKFTNEGFANRCLDECAVVFERSKRCDDVFVTLRVKLYGCETFKVSEQTNFISWLNFSRSRFVKQWLVCLGNKWLFQNGLPLYCLIDSCGLLHGPWLRSQSKTVRWYSFGQEIAAIEGSNNLPKITKDNGYDVFTAAIKLWLSC